MGHRNRRYQFINDIVVRSISPPENIASLSSLGQFPNSRATNVYRIMLWELPILTSTKIFSASSIMTFRLICAQSKLSVPPSPPLRSRPTQLRIILMTVGIIPTIMILFSGVILFLEHLSNSRSQFVPSKDSLGA